MENQEFNKQALDKFRQWHFWWLVVFSFLLIITFVYYLPTRFLHQSGQPHDMPGMPVDEGQPHAHDPSGSSVPNASPSSGVNGEMHGHMDEHVSMGMSHEDMISHMVEDHNMTQEEAEIHMKEMMGHDHEGAAADDHAGHVPTAYHEETDIKDGLVVNLNVNPVPYRVGIPLKFDFFVNNKPGSIPVPIKDLQVEHAKKIHIIGLRSDMNEFFHIHSEAISEEDATFTTEHIFKKPGMYKIWSSIMKDGMGHVFGHPALSINGDGPKEEKKVFFDRNVSSGNYQVSIDTGGSVVQKSESQIIFDIHTLTGQEVTVENYLDAQMHLVFIKDDWKQFIHTHPGGSAHDHSLNIIDTANAQGDGHTDHTHGAAGDDETIIFNVTFPEPGLYKGFAQFRPQGIDLPADEAITAEFWIEVLEKSPSILSQWWGLLLVSAVLMAILSWVVNNYLKVRPEDVTVSK